MNTVSWFLYFVSVVSALNVVAALVFFVCMGGLAWSLFFLNEADDKEDKAKYLTLVKKYIAGLLIVGFIGVATPNERTMYLIMGSEFGEEASNSETAKKVFDAVNKKLDEYLSEPKK